MCSLINLPSIQRKYLCNRRAQPERKECYEENKKRQKEWLEYVVQFPLKQKEADHIIQGVRVKMGKSVLASDKKEI